MVSIGSADCRSRILIGVSTCSCWGKWKPLSIGATMYVSFNYLKKQIVKALDMDFTFTQLHHHMHVVDFELSVLENYRIWLIYSVNFLMLIFFFIHKTIIKSLKSINVDKYIFYSSAKCFMTHPIVFIFSSIFFF